MKEDVTEYINFFALGAIGILAWYFYRDIKKRVPVTSIPTSDKPVVFGVRG